MAGFKRSHMIEFMMTMFLFGGCAIRKTEDIRQAATAISTTDLEGKPVMLPPSAPDRSHFTPLGYFTISSDSEFTGLLVLYSSAHGEQTVTYMELYNQAGRLVLIQWVEKSGVTKTAIDLGLLNDNSSELVGILGVIVIGTSA